MGSGSRSILTSRPRINQKFTLSVEKIHLIVNDYWQANKENRHKSLKNLQKYLEDALRRYKCRCIGRQQACELQNCWALPDTLLELLCEHLSLEVEGMADALHHSRHLSTWFSPYEIDQAFGAHLDLFKQSLKGRNAYMHPPVHTSTNNENIISQVIRKISEDLRGDKPTRAVLVIPIFEGKDGHIYETQARQAKFVEIVTFPKGSFLSFLQITSQEMTPSHLTSQSG